VKRLIKQARAINALSDTKARAQYLVILNHLIEPSLDSLGFIDANFVYEITPFGYTGSPDSDPSVPFQGRLEGFFDIENIEGEDTNTTSQTTCLKIAFGTRTVTNRFTTFSYDRHLLFPVSEIGSVYSMEEMRILYGKPTPEISPVDYSEELFDALQAHIDSARNSANGIFLFDARQTDGIDPWDYSDGNEHDLYDLRCLQIIANAQYGILQQDKERTASTHVEVDDFTFSGYYLGVTGFQGIKRHKKPSRNGNYKPHFAFEVFSTVDETVAANLVERVSPILFVPISDSVELVISKVTPEE
jgi:hypothetical protein